MADNTLVPKRPASLTQHKPLSNESKIAIALGALALKRNGEYSAEQQDLYAAALSKEPFDDVIATIDAIAERPRRDHEAACPDLGSLLQAVRALHHPHKHLREVVTKLARIFHETADEDFLMLYQEEAGHRTDEDLDKAYKALRGDESLKRMCTPAQFRAACGIPKVYRDGTRPA
jgi:hypothetical protein